MADPKEAAAAMQEKIQEKGAAAVQEMRLKGNQLVDKVRDLIQEGNTRRIIIKKEGRSLLEFPLSVGVGGAAAALTFQPMLSAIGALAAHFADIDVVIERIPGAPPVEVPPALPTAPPPTPGATRPPTGPGTIH